VFRGLKINIEQRFIKLNLTNGQVAATTHFKVLYGPRKTANIS